MYIVAPTKLTGVAYINLLQVKSLIEFAASILDRRWMHINEVISNDNLVANTIHVSCLDGASSSPDKGS